MKSKQIKTNINTIEQKLRKKTSVLGVSHFAKIVGVGKGDVSGWFNNKRNWSYEKILEVAGKFGL